MASVNTIHWFGVYNNNHCLKLSRKNEELNVVFIQILLQSPSTTETRNHKMYFPIPNSLTSVIVHSVPVHSMLLLMDQAKADSTIKPHILPKLITRGSLCRWTLEKWSK